MLRRVLGWGALGGILLALLQFLEYKHFIRAYSTEVYGGLVALIFTIVGIRLGLHLTRSREVVPVREVPAVAPMSPDVPDESAARETGLTPREREILLLIARGHSNREIADLLFVSENTVKTHASRVFEKLGVSRRVQAVQRGRELGLVP